MRTRRLFRGGNTSIWRFAIQSIQSVQHQILVVVNLVIQWGQITGEFRRWRRKTIPGTEARLQRRSNIRPACWRCPKSRRPAYRPWNWCPAHRSWVRPDRFAAVGRCGYSVHPYRCAHRAEWCRPHGSLFVQSNHRGGGVKGKRSRTDADRLPELLQRSRPVRCPAAKDHPFEWQDRFSGLAQPYRYVRNRDETAHDECSSEATGQHGKKITPVISDGVRPYSARTDCI